MSVNEIHVNDSGIDFRVTMMDDLGIVDIHQADIKEYRFQSPDGVMFVRDAQFYTDGYDGALTYSTVSTDFNQPGIWRYQVYLKIGPDEKFSDIGKFRVYPNLPLEG